MEEEGGQGVGFDCGVSLNARELGFYFAGSGERLETFVAESI